jgi:hypothetical protein
VPSTSTVYLLHFDPRYRHAGHYLGSTLVTSSADRIEAHLRGHGSPLVRAAVAAGCAVTVARTWRGDRKLERRLKDGHNSPQLCPICRGGGR